jgi:hypothetical protein
MSGPPLIGYRIAGPPADVEAPLKRQVAGFNYAAAGPTLSFSAGRYMMVW